MTDELVMVWEDPPADAIFGGSAGRYYDLMRALRANPSKWAVLPADAKTSESARLTANNVRKGRLKGFSPAGDFEAAVDGRKIYVRYAPKEPALSDVDAASGRGSMIRGWARAQGLDVPAEGLLFQALVDAYDREHSGR